MWLLRAAVIFSKSNWKQPYIDFCHINAYQKRKDWNETYSARIPPRLCSSTNISSINSSFVPVFNSYFPIIKQLLTMFKWKYWHSNLKQQIWIVFIFVIIVHISPAFKKFKLLICLWHQKTIPRILQFTKFKVLHKERAESLL